MDRTKLKNYAPKARREFIETMIERAAFFGLTADKTEPIVEKGDVAVIGGRSFPIAVARKRKSLEERIKRHGFSETMEAMAYTWFNRLVAIRYMELHGYLDHGYRVLSHPDGKPTPEIVEHAEHVDFPGLKKDRVIDLKLAGSKEGELYRLLLTAQCNALHSAMPFLFERIDDETELLLPDNLLNSDSLIRKLVNEIDDADWHEVEIIGWLYQFYISERKDAVIGKVVASEDIPAATQLFTPNWIVKYLVQNTLGRQWLATYPDSPLRQQMAYYIEPAEQTPEVQEQLKAITPTSLNPEELTLLDPACGSGHILVEAYDLFKAIYQERGYRAKDIPALILQKNLFGMEIDDRAAQLAAFALMMKARADDRRIFDSDAKPSILAIEDSQGMNADEIYFALVSAMKGEKEVELESPAPDGHLSEAHDDIFTRAEAAKAAADRIPTAVKFSQADIAALIELFEHAKTFGSLIQVPPKLAAKLLEIEKRLDDVLTHGDLTQALVHVLKPLIKQAKALATRYGFVVLNPPYMGRRNGMNDLLREFVIDNYPDSRADLYSAFIERALDLATPQGNISMITMQSWMFLSSFEDIRRHVLTKTCLLTMAHLGPRAFATISGEVVQTVCFAMSNALIADYRPTFFRLVDGDESEKSTTLLRRESKFFHRKQADFDAIPSCPIAYWATDAVISVFKNAVKLKDIAQPRQGLATGNNDRFLRVWPEVSISRIGFNHRSKEDLWKHAEQKWVPLVKGGEFRKWYGNCDMIIAFDKPSYIALKTMGNHCPSEQFYFREGITWSTIATKLSMRFAEGGSVFETKGAMCFAQEAETLLYLLGFSNSCLVEEFMLFISPTLDFHEGPFGTLPVKTTITNLVRPVVERCIEIAKLDWNENEWSWNFKTHPLLANSRSESQLEQSLSRWDSERNGRVEQMTQLELENNRLFIEAYGLQDELSPEVPNDQITLCRPNRAEDIKRLLSYAIACIMGRYSLDKPGLIYAHSGNQGFDSSEYMTFRADDDGIIPLLEIDWGIRDDATNRVIDFISTAWPKEHLEENLKFVSDSLGPTGSEQPRDTIRRYLSTGFYKHHLSMYKKRPIYWLFSSGKLRAFQCLVYLHRYNEGTLARMRTEYVIPLQGKIAARIDQLEGDKAKATSTSHRTKIQKEQDKLKKQQIELASFEEKLKHYADMRISLDLDDGVKVNYAKFGDLLAESKAITGGKDED